MFSLFGRRPSDLRQAISLYLHEVPENAPIRTVLSSDAIEQELKAFDRADARAVRKQRRYRRAAWVAWLAGVLGVIVVPLDLLPMGLPPLVTRVTYALHAIVLLLSFLAVILLGLRRSALHWKKARAAAEKARARVFEKILRAGPQHNALVDALACFKAAHLDWQMGFYSKRLSELPARIKGELSLANPFRLMGYALSGVAAAFGMIALLRFASDQGWPVPFIPHIAQWLSMISPADWQHGFKATAMSLLAFAGTRLLSHEDISNAALYPWAKEQLQRLRDIKLPLAEGAAATGNVQAVLDFRRDVQSILDAESKAWASTEPSPPP